MDGVYGLLDAAGRRIAVFAVAHRFVDSFDQVGWSLKIKSKRVSDIQRKDFVSLFDDFVGDAGKVADGIANIV